jgi:glucuronokinase
VSTIPRSVGLAGSSALAVAAIDALAAWWAIALDRRVVAALALAAEAEVLGIPAGWQDRVVQAERTAVLVDAAQMDVVDGLEVPAVRRLAGSPGGGAGARLVVGWSATAASDSSGYHAGLRADQRDDPGRHRSAMAELAALARRAADAWDVGDVGGVAAAMDEGWRIRQRVAPLRPDHAAIVEIARRAGVAATTPGSGGAVIAIAEDEGEAARIVRALRGAGLASASVRGR